MEKVALDLFIELMLEEQSQFYRYQIRACLIHDSERS